MNSQINGILSKYQNEEITREEANAQLKEAGAGFYLEALSPEERQSQREIEDAMGFFEVPEDQQPPRYPRTPDMGRVEGLANQVIIVKTLSGMYEVTYDRKGYATKAKKVDWVPPGEVQE